jgi:anthranilate phosphoribosyltransferase
MDIHSGAARLLDQPRMAVFRGEGGEIERRPNKPTQVWMTKGRDEPMVENWPALSEQPHQPPNTEMDIRDLARTWRGEMDDPYAIASVVGTIAVTLRTMGRASAIDEAEVMARDIWAARDKDFVSA